MKTKLFALLLLLAPSLAVASFDHDLKYGGSGQAVRDLQHLLATEGCLTVNPTGNFLNMTFAGVKCFQTKHALPVTGYFGPLSRAVANGTTTPAEVGNGCLNKKKGDPCGNGLGICDNALNGDLLFCVPKRSQ